MKWWLILIIVMLSVVQTTTEVYADTTLQELMQSYAFWFGIPAFAIAIFFIIHAFEKGKVNDQK